MNKKYTIAETTKVQRQKIARDALGISTLDAAMPSEQTMRRVQEYIDGQKEISTVLEETIAQYRKA